MGWFEGSLRSRDIMNDEQEQLFTVYVTDWPEGS